MNDDIIDEQQIERSVTYFSCMHVLRILKISQLLILEFNRFGRERDPDPKSYPFHTVH